MNKILLGSILTALLLISGSGRDAAAAAQAEKSADTGAVTVTRAN